MVQRDLDLAVAVIPPLGIGGGQLRLKVEDFSITSYNRNDVIEKEDVIWEHKMN